MEESLYYECQVCGRKYTISKKKSGHTKLKCNSCCTNATRTKIKDKINEYKSQGCSICGYRKCISAIQFHHINPEEKEFEISSSLCRSWDKIEKEIAKCILVCANCHIEIHNS